MSQQGMDFSYLWNQPIPQMPNLNPTPNSIYQDSMRTAQAPVYNSPVAFGDYSYGTVGGYPSFGEASPVGPGTGKSSFSGTQMGYPAGQVTSQPIPDIPWNDPFGGGGQPQSQPSLGGGAWDTADMWGRNYSPAGASVPQNPPAQNLPSPGSDMWGGNTAYNPGGASKTGMSEYLKGYGLNVAPSSADYQTHDAWQRDYDAYMGGSWPPAQPATDFADTYFQRAGGNPFNAPRQPEKWDGLGQQDWFTAATSNAAPPPQQPAYPMSSGGGSPDYGRVQPDPFGNMWGGNAGYSPSSGYAPPDSADYQSFDSFMNAMNAYNSGASKTMSDYLKGYGLNVPTPEPRPGSAPGTPLQMYDPGTSFGTQGGDNSRMQRYGGEMELADITRSSDLGRNAIAEQVMRGGKSGQMLPSAVFGGYGAEAMWRDPFANSQRSTGNLSAGGIYQDPFGGSYPAGDAARNGVSGRPLPDYQYAGFGDPAFYGNKFELNSNGTLNSSDLIPSYDAGMFNNAGG